MKRPRPGVVRRAGSLAAIGLVLLASPALGQAPAPAPPSLTSGPLFRAAPDGPPSAPAPSAPPAATGTPARIAVRLDYSRGPGAEGCPDEQGFRDAVAANVGYDPFAPVAPRLATVSIARQGGAFVGALELRSAAGAREWAHAPLTRTDCRDLVRVMGLSIAIPIDPFPAHPLPAPPASVEPAAPPALSLPLPSPPPAPATDDRQRAPLAPAPLDRPKLRLGLRAGIAVGTSPIATGTFAVEVGARWRLASISVEGRADVPGSGAGNVAPMARVSAGLFAGSLVPCWHAPLPARVTLPVCGVLTLGAIRGEGLSVDVPQSGAGFYAATGGRAGLEVPVNDSGSIALRVDGEVLGAIKPVTITLNGQDAWTTGHVSAGAGGALRVEF